jgi:hypothetical protein
METLLLRKNICVIFLALDLQGVFVYSATEFVRYTSTTALFLLLIYIEGYHLSYIHPIPC